jgi:hypothetical protein
METGGQRQGQGDRGAGHVGGRGNGLQSSCQETCYGSDGMPGQGGSGVGNSGGAGAADGRGRSPGAGQ